VRQKSTSVPNFARKFSSQVSVGHKSLSNERALQLCQRELVNPRRPNHIHCCPLAIREVSVLAMCRGQQRARRPGQCSEAPPGQLRQQRQCLYRHSRHPRPPWRPSRSGRRWADLPQMQQTACQASKDQVCIRLLGYCSLCSENCQLTSAGVQFLSCYTSSCTHACKGMQ